MTDLAWFEGTSGQSTEELIALEGQYRTDSLVAAFHTALLDKLARVGETGLSMEEHVVIAVEALETEVNNGGYNQFFFNTPEFAPTIVDALNRIGCPEVAALTQEAIGHLGISGPLTPEAVDEALAEENEARDDALGQCDVRYYAEAGDLAEPLLEYIKANRDSISL